MEYIFQNKYVHFKKEGEGQPIILLHGWGSNSDTFLDFIKIIKSSYTVFAIDLPGFGQSEEPLNPYNLDDYVKLIEQFVFDKQLLNPILIGHSFGGRIAIKYASKNPVKKLILIDSAGLKPRFHFIVKGKIILYKLKKRWYKLNRNVVKYNNLINNSGSNDYKNASPIMKKTMTNIVNEYLDKHLKKIQCETLILWGKMDNVTPYKDALKLKKKIINSGLVTFEGVGHFPYIEAKKTFHKIIKEYLGVK